MTEPELDPKLAAKLRAAAEHEPYPVLDDAARLRVLRALQNEPVRKRRVPWMQISMAVAAAALLAVMVRRSGPACELPTDVAFADHTLDLGRFGKVVLDADAAARLSKTSTCELEITLEHGTLAAALHDLKPARLSVRTPLGAVEVRGTTFSVAYEDKLEVVLLEGAVALRHEDTTTALAPGRALTRSGVTEPETAPVAPAQERKLRTLLNPEPPAPKAAPVQALPQGKDAPEPVVQEAPVARPRQNATELLAAAERERRAGELTRARALYREAGGAAGGDAEVALLRWTRLEIEEHPQAALDVLTRYRARYGKKLERARLGAEASFLEVQVLEKLGRHDEAKQRARELVQRYPNSPQGRAAAAW